MKNRFVVLVLTLALFLFTFGGCGNGEQVSSEILPSPSPVVTATPTPSPKPTPTPAPTPTPLPEYRDMTEEDYKTFFSEPTTQDEFRKVLMFLPVGDARNGLSIQAVKNVWEYFYSTDNDWIGNYYDFHFEDNTQTVTGDASKLFDWLGIVTDKGIAESADERYKIAGDILTIDCTDLLGGQDRFKPIIEMAKVSLQDMYIFYHYRTRYDAFIPDVYRTAFFQKDTSGKYQLQEIFDREADSTVPADPAFNFSLPGTGKMTSYEDWQDYVDYGGYRKHVSTWDTPPTQYKILDIGGDGTQELILSSSVDGVGFSTFTILTLDLNTGEVEPVEFFDAALQPNPYAYCHNGLRYSQKYRAIVYKSMNNGSAFGVFDYYTLEGNELSYLQSIGYDTFTSPGTTTYLLSKDGETHPLSQEEYGSLLEEAEFVEFDDLPNL